MPCTILYPVGGRSRACRGAWSPHFAAATDDIKRNEAAFSSHEIAIRQRGDSIAQICGARGAEIDIDWRRRTWNGRQPCSNGLNG